MSDVNNHAPLSAATDGIRKMMMVSQGNESGNACQDCQSPNIWCNCQRLAQAALDGLFEARYDVTESR